MERDGRGICARGGVSSGLEVPVDESNRGREPPHHASPDLGMRWGREGRAPGERKESRTRAKSLMRWIGAEG